MAITTTEFATQRQGFFETLLARFNRNMEAYIEKQSRRDQLDALEAKSDEELARMGLTRDRIPQYVFSDLFWI